MDRLWAFLISILPIVELRGGLVFARLANIPFVQAFLICLAGNLLPIPFILLFLQKIFLWLEKFAWTKKIVDWLKRRARAKSGKIQNGQLVALFLFVAIPLPGTGGWTGALIASVLGLPKRKSFPAIGLGIVGAGIIMSVLAYLLPEVFGKIFGFTV